MKSLSQFTRLLILIIYVILLFVVSKIAFDSWIPPTAEKGLWFYSGLAALLLGNLLVTPFFTKPVDAISNAVAAIVALLAVNIWGSGKFTGFDQFIWAVVCIYVIIVLISSILAIVLKDSPNLTRQKISKSLYFLSDAVGTSRLVFSAVFLFALIAFHRNIAREYLVIGISWVVFVGLQPIETLANLLRRWWEVWQAPAITEQFGEVVGHQIPGVVLVRHQEGAKITFGDTIIVQADDGRPGLALALDHVGFAEGLWMRALHLSISHDSRSRLGTYIPYHDTSEAIPMKVDPGTMGIQADTDLAWKKRSNLIGLVAPETDVTRLRIELVRTDLDLREGHLVEVQIGSKMVLYQIINGLTKEEILQQKNTRGYVRADAKKIGCWNEQNRSFEVVKWIPQPNAPVFSIDFFSSTPEGGAIGHFPGTNYPVSVEVDSLVTHNTAILGILGVGKSFLALELVERMIKSGIKVICLDLTNQYAEELDPYYNFNEEKPDIEELNKIGIKGKNNAQQNVEEGGSVQQFENLIKDKLRVFLGPKKQEKMVKIFNPVQFEVWRQDSKPFKERASMASLTPTEITRLITEATLQVLQEQGMSEKARCCIVFEEAHSLIPEWMAVVSEGDKTATNGTAKAILQGRKYGLGCVVITQRTANVTKTILNQCNTVFALRVFDATGMEFLKNYIGEDYAGVLSTLEDRHAVVFGRASSCRDPVLIHLNERSDFLRVFRKPNDIAKKNI
jgi:hypothetical protein